MAADQPRSKRRKIEESDEDARVTTLTQLPPEVIVLICQYLTVKDKLCLKLVNKQTYSLLSDHVFWREIRLTDSKGTLHKSFIKIVFRMCCLGSLKHLELPESIPYNNENVKKLSKCQSIERLSWTAKANDLSKLPSASLTHLHLNLSRTRIGESLFPHAAFENLSHLVVSQRYLERADIVGWTKANCRPPFIAFVTSSLYWFVNLDFHPESDRPGCISLFTHRKPPALQIPLIMLPRLNFSVGPLTKIYTKVEGPDTYPLLVLDNAVNPDIFQSNTTLMFGYVVSPGPSSVPPIVPYATVSVSNLCCLDFSHQSIHQTFLDAVLSRTPNLMEVNLSRCTLLSLLDDCLSMLPSYCPRLKGLNISSIGNCGNCDKQHLWYTLSQMKQLEYLIISSCLLLVAGAEKLDEPGNLVGTRQSKIPTLDTTIAQAINVSISEMTSLRALQVMSCRRVCSECTDPAFQSLAMENVLVTAAGFVTLHYLFVLLDCSKVAGKLRGMERVLANIPKLQTLRIESRGLMDLPENFELYANLENLAIKTPTSLSTNFITAITLNGNNRKLKQLGLIVNGLPVDGIFNILNSCRSLHTCVVYCGRPPVRAYAQLVRNAKKLAKTLKLDKFDFRMRCTYIWFGYDTDIWYSLDRNTGY